MDVPLLQCIRCHPGVFAIERTSPDLNPYNISIPHRFHIEQLKNFCTSCHYNIYHDPHDPSTFRPTKEACFEYHRREKTSCSTCHPKGSIPLPKTTEVSHSECAKCHKGFENAKIKIYNFPIPHQKHIASILNCNVCHASGDEHGKILKTRVECLSCHHKTTSKCTDCHETQVKFIQGESLGKKDPQPDVMADGVKGIECHTTISQGHSLAEVKKTCVQCHEARYEKMTEEGQKEISERMKKLKLSFETLRLQKKMAPDPEKRKIEALAKEVENLLKAIDEDKSKGVHSFIYAQKLTAESEAKVLKAKRSLSK